MNKANSYNYLQLQELLAAAFIIESLKATGNNKHLFFETKYRQKKHGGVAKFKAERQKYKTTYK